ncbi:hypothetical protein PGTUg99_032814 [Puccinia graminis f. sp. tritici]|uniref:Retrotransposon gag domain-containing protein n=1 Tax=Puccinia graminis f. sp. tritici TaxID=56615 RepID=A0A5B0RIW8_PUCGR|nr:hypothetical protein PGTUg99_032814 [Puccinia graminis f. sp. tritici]
MLTSVTAFEQGLIDSFGDKFQLNSAKRALAACKQGKRLIEEYNAEYSTLCYQVVNSEDARIDKYVEGLNYDIINKAMSKEWLEEPTLAGKMRRALDASQHRPLSLLRARINIQTRPIELQMPWTSMLSRRRVPRPRNSVLKGCSKRCVWLNGVTPEARKKFVEQYRFAVPVQVSEVSFGPRPPGESITRRRSMFSVPLPYQLRPKQPQQASIQQSDSSEVEPETLELDQSAFSFQEMLEEVEEAGVSTIQVQLDCSKAGRMLIPVSFKTSSHQSTIASVLIDTGSMANFVSDRFVAKHRLPTHNRQKPIKCVGFDGSSGVGGMVTKDWSGEIVMSLMDAQPITLPCSFGVTRLGSVDAIFGLPWLDSQSWSASGSVQQGHQLTLGDNHVFVVDSSDLGEGIEGKVASFRSVLSTSVTPPSFNLPDEFQQFADELSRPLGDCTIYLL